MVIYVVAIILRESEYLMCIHWLINLDFDINVMETAKKLAINDQNRNLRIFFKTNLKYSYFEI